LKILSLGIHPDYRKRRGFFPFASPSHKLRASLRVRMTEKRGDSSVAYATSDAVLSEAKE